MNNTKHSVPYMILSVLLCSLLIYTVDIVGTKNKYEGVLQAKGWRDDCTSFSYFGDPLSVVKEDLKEFIKQEIRNNSHGARVNRK